MEDFPLPRLTTGGYMYLQPVGTVPVFVQKADEDGNNSIEFP